MTDQASYLCPKEVAIVLGVSPRTAQRLMRSGEIESFQVGRQWRTNLEQVARYVKRQLAAAQRPAA